MQTNLSRRDVMAGLSAASLATIATSAFAKAPLLNTPAPGFNRFKIGAIEATVVSDGPLDLAFVINGVPEPINVGLLVIGTMGLYGYRGIRGK